jgi:hypothetical protein
VETIDKGFRVTLNHKTLGYVRLLIAIPSDGAVTIQPGLSEALSRLERLAKIAAGTDDTDEQIAMAQARVKEINDSIEAETDVIKKEQSKIAVATARYTRHRRRTNGPFVYVDDYLLPEGEALVRESNDRIAESNKEIAKITIERGHLQGQAIRLADGTVGAELKKMPAEVLAAVNPVVLTFEAVSGLNKKELGTIELTLVAGAEGVKVAARAETSPVPNPATPAAAPAPRKAYASIADVLKEIPAGVAPREASGWSAVKIEVANEALRKCTGATLTTTLNIKSDSIEKSDGKWVVRPQTEKVATRDVIVICTCPDSMKAQLAMCNDGDSVRVIGTITSVDIDDQASNHPLTIFMETAKDLERVAVGGVPVTPTAILPVKPATPKKTSPAVKNPPADTPTGTIKRVPTPGELFPDAK